MSSRQAQQTEAPTTLHDKTDFFASSLLWTLRKKTRKRPKKKFGEKMTKEDEKIEAAPLTRTPRTPRQKEFDVIKYF